MGRQPVLVEIDVHEPERIRTELASLGAAVKPALLPIGDYRTEQVLVERKTVRDLHLTLVSGRLWGQLGRLRATGRRALLLVEGRFLDAGPVSPPAIRGALLAAAENGVTVVRSETEVDSALWLYRIACRAERIGRAADRPLYAQRPKQTAPSATAEAILASIPGLSTTSARSLLEQFGSVEAIVHATDAELKDVVGIGRVRAQAIRAAVTHRHSAYRSRRSRE